MGTSKTASQLTAKLNAAAKEISDSKDALSKAGMVAKTLFTAEASRAGVGPAGRSKVARSIKARYDVTDRSSVLVRYVGQAHLVNNPTQPHTIEPRDDQGAVMLADGQFRAVVTHPGTRGKRFFEKAKHAAEITVPKVLARETLTAPLRKLFG